MAGKELVRSTDDRVIAGVCAGLASYLNLDPGVVRIITVVVSLFTGVPIIAYLIAMFVLPERATRLR
ncbi:MAG TPA: PspC domain-containing protein [Candidatus Avipropionibacterium avicola]|uniref:PspC domain-containing protein n=1 Tax=Candidatus Avipropionibacterium avicola TaxID=2840701 RepID=A0A9D1GXE6_9ACTN|nr:PspC domain-containing protein [Candidatus Avipropionibacterium avicola]